MTPLFARLLEDLDERFRLRQPARKTANKVFPHNWSFLLGEVALFAFVILVASGVFLTMFFRPSTEPTIYSGSLDLYAGSEINAAFESILRLSYDVPGGLLMRRVHRAASHLFIASIVLHMLRVILTGAFRRPRELNYVVGIVLLMFAFGSGFTGYSLIWDSLAGNGVRIAYSMLLGFPFVGEQVAFWIFGGDFPTGDVVPRFFVFHVMVLPALLIGAISLHLVLLVRQKHTQFPRLGVDGHRLVYGKPLWPAQFAESITLLLWTGGVLAASAVLVPWSDVALIGPYVPGEVPNNAQPDWFMFWLDGALRIVPGIEVDLPGVVISGPFIAGIVLPGLVFGGLLVYPWIERRVYHLSGDWHVLQNPLEIPLRAAMVVGTFLFVLILSAGTTSDQLSRITGVHIETVLWFFRITCILVPVALSWLIYRYSKRRLAKRGLDVPRDEVTANERYLTAAGAPAERPQRRSEQVGS